MRILFVVLLIVGALYGAVKLTVMGIEYYGAQESDVNEFRDNTETVIVSGSYDSLSDPERERLALELFDHLVELSSDYDKAIADYYADKARIIIVREYPYGTKRTMEIPGSYYKKIIGKSMWIARIKGDKSIFSDISTEVTSEGVVISANRFCTLRGYTSPFRAIVRPNSEGKWLIYEEHSVSRPF